MIIIRPQTMLSLKVLTLLVQALVGSYAASNVATSEVKERGGLLEAGNTGWQDDPGHSSRIHGGALDTTGKFKSTVHIEVFGVFVDTRDQSRRPYISKNDCSGLLISPRWILTAASCLPCPHLYQLSHRNRRYISNRELIEVHAQCDNCTKGIVNKYFAHNESRISHHDCLVDNNTVTGVDIALLELIEEFVFTGSFGSSAMMSGIMEMIKVCVALGYGDQYEEPPSASVPVNDNQLHHVQVISGNESFCQDLPDLEDADRDYYICARSYVSPASGACPGDTGGSLLCRARGGDIISVGVLSWFRREGGRCRDKNFGMVYVSTGRVEEWIKTITSDDRIVFKNL